MKTANPMSRRPFIVFAVITLLFLATRFLGFSQIYHQDEYKWAMIVNPAFGLALQSDHPPLDGILYRLAGEGLGYEHLRFVPIIASTLLFALVIFFVWKRFGKRAAVWTGGILLVSTYELIASIQIDIDGALLPLAGMISIYCFYRVDLRNLRARENRLWIGLFLASVVFGFLLKLSYVLFLGAILTEALFLLWHIHGKVAARIFAKLLLGILSAIVLAALAVLAAKYIFNISHVGQFLSHAKDFGVLNFSSRNYMEVIFLTLKAFVFASPLLIAPYLLLITSKESVKELRLWLIILFYNFIFYYVIFDFSNRTLERYDMFLILPGAVVLGVLLSREYDRLIILTGEKGREMLLYATIALGGFLAALPLLSRFDTIPLNPKTAFIDHVKHLNFKFLIPLSGGSGPIGFYTPALFVLVGFLIAFGSLMLFVILKSFAKREHEKIGVALFGVFLGACLVFNLITMNEFAFGGSFGNPSSVAKNVIQTAIASSTIPQVITYNDIGGYELNSSKKYFKRFYTDPMFAESNVGKFSSYSGYYLVIDFPAIDKNGVYSKYLSTCAETYRVVDKEIKGYLFDCRKADAKIFNSSQ